MKANMLSLHTPTTPGVGPKVVLHIKLKGIEHRAPHESKYAVIKHTNDPWGGVKWSFCFFSKSGHVAYQIKVEEV